jgi:hypothetical protein
VTFAPLASVARLVQRYSAILPALMFLALEHVPPEAMRSTPTLVFRTTKVPVGVLLVPGAILAVLPDGYVAFSGSLQDLPNLERALQSLGLSECRAGDEEGSTTCSHER